MKAPRITLALVAASSLALAGLVNAAPRSYQVTGPILEVTDTTIVVQKGNEKWELARDANTKVTGELKVGAKVTISYTMTASSIESKEAKAPEKPADKPAAKPEATPKKK